MKQVKKNKLNESTKDLYTLDQLLKDQNYNGDLQAFVNRLQSTYNQYCRKNKLTPITITNKTRISGGNWLKLLTIASQNSGGAMGQYFKQVLDGANKTINAKSAAEGLRDALNANPDADLQIGVTGGFNPGADQGRNPNGKPMTFLEIMNVIQGLASQNPNNTSTFTQTLTGSSGVLRGQNPDHVRKTILNQLNRVKPTLQQTNPKGYQMAETTLNAWLSGRNQSITMREVASAMSTIGKVLNASRNDIPVVMGFQKTLNYFGIKDAKGRPYGVDGAIGQNTSYGLKQLGYQNIFEFKADVEKIQAALGIKVDGKVGDETLTAFQRAGIDTFQKFKSYATRKANMDQGSIAHVNNPVQMPTLSENKIRVTESELKQLIRESIKDTLNGFFASIPGTKANKREKARKQKEIDDRRKKKEEEWEAEIKKRNDKIRWNAEFDKDMKNLRANADRKYGSSDPFDSGVGGWKDDGLYHACGTAEPNDSAKDWMYGLR